MTRILTLAAAVLACGFVYLLVAGMAVPEVATDRAMFIVSTVSLLVSIFAVAFAATAALRVRTLRADLAHLARSVDAALAGIATQRRREATEAERQQPGVPAGRGGTSHAQATPPATAPRDQPTAPNVVPHPAFLRDRPAAPQTQPPAPARPRTDTAMALERVAAAGSMEINLRPIVSTAGGATLGFDVLAHLRPEAGPPADLWRIDLARPERAATTERLLVAATLDAARRPNRESVPLHVAISPALLDDRDEAARLVGLLKTNADAARAVVLCLPTAIMRAPGGRSATLAHLAATGLRFAAEGWPQSIPDLEGVWRSGVSFVRLPAAKLLAGDLDAADEPDGETVLETLAACAMTAIATDSGDATADAALAACGVTMRTTEPRAGAVDLAETM